MVEISNEPLSGIDRLRLHIVDPDTFTVDYDDIEKALQEFDAALRHAEPSEPVAVKPLEWQDVHKRFEASTFYGQYAGFDTGTYVHLRLYPQVTPPHLGEAYHHKTISDAKAAAQADYETRILAALVPAPVGVDIEEVKQMVIEAAAKLIEDNIIQDTSRGKVLVPRQKGNRDGLHYAISIRALLSKIDGGGNG